MSERGLRATVYALTILFALLPLAVIRFPPLNDYPFHLARIDIITRLPHSEFLQSAYRLNTFLLPNVGMDLVMLALGRLMPVEFAGRVFLALMQCLILLGVTLLNHALFRRVSLAAVLLGGIFLHNWILLFGFLNYLLGAGVLLVGAAVWVYCEGRSFAVRVLWGCLFAVLIYFSHMLVLGFWALVIGAFELQRAAIAWKTTRRRQIQGIVALLITLVLPLILFSRSRTGHEAGSAIRYAPVWWAKPFAFARTFLSADLAVDVVTCIVIGALCAFLIYRRSIRLSSRMCLPLAALMVLFLVMPLDLFSAQFVDIRIPIVLVFFTIASMRVENRAVVAILLVLLAFRSVMIAADWKRYDAVYAQYMAAFSKMSDGGALFTATAQPPPSSIREWIAHWQPPTSHIASLAVLEKEVFVPGTWAHPSQQPITVSPRFQAMYSFQDHDPLRFESVADLERITRRIAALNAEAGGTHSYLLLLAADQWRRPIPTTLVEVGAGTGFRLFEIVAR